MTRTKMTVAWAQAYSFKRSMGAGTTSTLRKVSRAFRIAEGERPVPGAKLRTRTMLGKTQVYHPTKGWRWA